jgi:hypothetical protein
LRAYEKFERKVKIWELHVKHFMTDAEAALTLFTSLKGEAEQELEFVEVSTIYRKGGVDTILSYLKQAFQQKTVYIKRQYLHDYEAIGRWPGESLRTYINRYRRVEASLKAIGIDIGLTYDDESRGSRLLDRARLSVEQQRLVLVGSAQSLSFDAIRAALMLQYPEHRQAPPVAGREATTAPYQSKGAGKSGSGASSTPSTTSANVGKGKGKDKGLERSTMLRQFLRKPRKKLLMPKMMQMQLIWTFQPMKVNSNVKMNQMRMAEKVTTKLPS